MRKTAAKNHPRTTPFLGNYSSRSPATKTTITRAFGTLLLYTKSGYQGSKRHVLKCNNAFQAGVVPDNTNIESVVTPPLQDVP